MLSRPYRLTKKNEIDRVFRRGQSFFTGTIGVKAARNGKELSRFAIIVSTKVAKKATLRNRLKRQLREMVRLMREDVSPGYDVVVVSRAGMEKSSREELQRALAVAFLKLGLTRPARSSAGFEKSSSGSSRRG